MSQRIIPHWSRRSQLAWGLMALALMVGACGDDDPTSPNPAVVQTMPVFDAFGFNAGITGQGTLTRTEGEVEIALDVNGLIPNHAYTVWFVVFNVPSACAATECFPPDLGVPEVQATLQGAGGFVSDGSSRMFLSRLDRSNSEGREVILGTGGIANPMAAQVDIVLRDHGPAETDPANRAAQTSQMNGFCGMTLEMDVDLTSDGCYDVAVVGFPPPVA